MEPEKIKQIVEEILKAADLEGEVALDVKKDDFIRINIQTPEAGYLIGRGGDNLKALQQICRAVINKKSGEPVRVLIDVNGYQEGRLSILCEEAVRLAKEVARTGYSKWLEPMNSYERRAVHVALAEMEGIETESEGQGEERKVVIRPKSN